MKKINDLLLTFKEKDYGDFIYRLTPGFDRDYFIGVRVPIIRKLAKEVNKEDAKIFLKELPHKYYEENLLHGFIIQQTKDYHEAIDRFNEFLPYVNAWAISDTITPAVFKNHRDTLINEIYKWLESDNLYTVRFAIVNLMNLYLDDYFKKEYLNLPAKKACDEYYVNMVIAWFYATALYKKYDDTIKIIEAKTLPTWIHNKSIQKAIESNKVSAEHKEYLKTLKK